MKTNAQHLIEELKDLQTRFEKLLAEYEQSTLPVTEYVVPATTIALQPGERYAGLLLDDKGNPSHHLILLPGDADDSTWNNAQTWATEQGGELPTRREQSLLFANLKGEFQPAWYWSCEANGNASAWGQSFTDGSQDDDYQLNELRARAVRRVFVGKEES